MNPTARQHFSQWYQKADYSFDGTIMENRLSAISGMQSEGTTYWLDLIKIYLGIDPQTVNSRNRLVEHFTASDPTFPPTENENLLRILSAISLAIFFDESESDAAYLAALAAKNSVFFQQFLVADFPYVTKYSEKNISRYAKNVRASSYSAVHSSLNAIEKRISENGDAKEQLQLTKQDLKNIHNAISSLETAVDSMREESNVLWWLFGGHSVTAKMLFHEAEVSHLLVAVAKDLFNITQFYSHITKSKEFLAKALHSGRQSSEQNDSSAYGVLNATPEEIKVDIANTYGKGISVLTPVMLALKSHRLLKADDWSTHFKGESNGADVKKQVNLVELCNQVYLELIFLNMLEND